MSFLNKIKGMAREITTIHYTADMYCVSGDYSEPVGTAYAQIRVWENKGDALAKMKCEIDMLANKQGSEYIDKGITLINVRRM